MRNTQRWLLVTGLRLRQRSCQHHSWHPSSNRRTRNWAPCARWSQCDARPPRSSQSRGSRGGRWCNGAFVIVAPGVVVFAARAGTHRLASTGTPFACGARCRRYWTTHLASTKPDLPANARDLAWTILRFFCTVEHDDEATRRCLNSIVAILRSVAGASDNKKQLVDYNQHLVAAVAEAESSPGVVPWHGATAAECSAASCAWGAHRNSIASNLEATLAADEIP